MSLNRLIKKIKKNSNTLRLVVIGLDNAGKTTILNRLMNKDILSTDPTMGYRTYIHRRNNFTLVISDIGGQQIFRSFWHGYFESTDGVVYVVDASDSRAVTAYVNEILDMTSGIPVVICVNKIDLTGIDCFQRIVAGLEGKKSGFSDDQYKVETKIGGNDVLLVACSAVTNLNIECGFDWIISKSLSRAAVDE